VRKITRRKWNKTIENTGEELHKQEKVERKKKPRYILSSPHVRENVTA
jgi:hypothetical protein